MFGIINCNKPIGITSRVVVNAANRRVRPAKVGHAGTLDPLASGVLLLPVGPAVRLTSYLQELPKQYRATFQLGVETSSGDLEETPIPLANAPVPTAEQIADAAQALTGRIQQVPPAHSAIKVDGKRAYRLARAGKAVEMKPRTVDIYALEIIKYDYPNLQVHIHCGSGTYVRSIGVDLARACGTVAVMTSLERTAIGDFTVEDAHSIEQLREQDIEPMLQSPLRGLPEMPQVELDEATLKRIEQGQIVDLHDESLQTPQAAETELAAIDAEQNLRALLIARGGGWRAHRSFHTAS
ncbi:tRNA pseudouridine(55) synthase TruB [Roseimaritima ulvae]|uniref:tRNA pseudouridine synthase B n=1 Tax=Roseimaritima ulvae TaxID=980254 RepID=A0A5B9QUE0_9BACT|nr:tRNA pseudouridine(55) synthase TruB [Roseimaritima ulvae]QEG42667.1 tRNA pseudouridine synthase B [Roseimaritima ulvae]